MKRTTTGPNWIGFSSCPQDHKLENQSAEILNGLMQCLGRFKTPLGEEYKTLSPMFRVTMLPFRALALSENNRINFMSPTITRMCIQCANQARPDQVSVNQSNHCSGSMINIDVVLASGGQTMVVDMTLKSHGITSNHQKTRVSNSMLGNC
ncbi:hypothetical protein ZHAS_00015923 [Anopheles sinensis]|uniref:Uncharacterized protein n=1 Tax=Anopheles sinensis TaxID=74873 RepID=A0A084WCA8_ANOSI|nr:hypothetical protein ZHAS_00015923 [Anopheles sinensis]